MRISDKVYWIFPTALGLLAMCVCLVGGAIVAANRIPSIAEQIPPGSSPVHVNLLMPPGNSTWPLNAFIPVRVVVDSATPAAAVELFVNGQLYDSKSSPKNWTSKSFASQWSWQPGTQGDFILLARAIDQAGQTGISNPVKITATEATGTHSPIQIQEGDTLESISTEYGISITEIISTNPGVNLETSLNPGDIINIPNPPQKVTNPKVIPGYPLQPPDIEKLLPTEGNEENPPEEPSKPPEESEENPPEEPSGDGNKFDMTGIDLISAIKFWLEKSSGTSQDELPNPPDETLANFNGCDVILNIAGWFNDPLDPNDPWNRKNEDGFFIYRSRNGAPFERIATLPAIKSSVTDKQKSWPYIDKAQFGEVTYYISTFNTAGESPSPPVTLPLDAMNCQDPSGGDPNLIRLENGDLILPYALDVAYLYMQINGSGAIRVPEGDRTFLPESGKRFNLNVYLDSIVSQVSASDLEIHMEVWGWSGGQLIFAGEFDTKVHRATLLICSVEGKGGCTGSGGGQWVSEVFISPDKPVQEQKYEARWQVTSLNEIDELCTEYAAAPFQDDAYFNVQQAIKAGCDFSVEGKEGTYLIDLGYLLYTTKDLEYWENGWGAGYNIFEYNSNWFYLVYPPGTAFTLYHRALARMKTEGYNSMSNVVVLHYNTPPLPSEAPPLASTYPSIYDVQILRETYHPPDFLKDWFTSWGCVVVEEDPTGTWAPGVTVCPGLFPPEEECGDWDFFCLVEEAWESWEDWFNKFFVQPFQMIKDEIISSIVSIIPGCSDSSWCQTAVQIGFETGFKAITGVPPTLPNFDELVSKNITSAVVSELGGIDIPYCDASCQGDIGAEVIGQLRQVKSAQSQTACNVLDAPKHAQRPNCLDPSIIVHPAPGSNYFPGFIEVKVTRKTTPESLAVQKTDADKYQLSFAVDGTNTTRKGYFWNVCHYVGNLTQDQLPDPNNPKSLANYHFQKFTEDIEQRPLYKTVQVAIPWLEPGESVTIPIVLNPDSPGSLSPYCELSYRWVDTQYLYFQGSSHMKATEACYSEGSSVPWVPCLNGGVDTWDFDNPVSP